MRKIVTVACSLLMAFGVLTGCTGGQYALPYYDQSADDVLNSDLFYRNDMKAACADPTVIYIDDESDEENYGWFYMYLRRTAISAATAFLHTAARTWRRGNT